MNRIVTTLLVLISTISSFAVSVNDVSGAYKGSLNIGGTAYNNKTIYILPGGTDNTITFVLPDFTYNSASLGNIVLVNIPMNSSGKLTLDNSSLYIKAINERASISVLNDFKDGNKTYNSIISASSAQVLLSINAPSLPEPILVLFSGSRLDNNYAVTNGGFEGTWTNGEPDGWHSFNTATGSYVTFVQNTTQFTRSTEKRPGSSGSQSALIKTDIIVGNNANGNCTNGQINAGSMDADDASGNYNFSDPNNAKYNTPFVGNPDSLVFWAKYIPADNNPNNSVNKARAHAVITTNARYQDPEVSNYSSIKVAEATINYSATSSMGWQRLSVPFVYSSVNPASTAYMLITFTTNMTPGGGSSHSEGFINPTKYVDNVYLDDVEMIYNHSLTTLKMDGQTVNFNNGTAVSQRTFSDSQYNFVASTNSKAARTFFGFDAQNNKVYIYVVADNYSQSKAYSVYTLQMAKPIVDTEYAYSASTCDDAPYSDELFSNLTESGVYTTKIPNTKGGDSIITLTLDVFPTYLNTKTISVNVVDTTWRGRHFAGLPVSDEPYVFYDSLTSSHGCDSVFKLLLYVSDIPVTYGNYEASFCDGDYIEFEGVRYSQSTEEDVRLAQPNAYGGDSIVHLVVNMLPTYTIDDYLTMTVGEARTWETFDLSTMPVGELMLSASYYTIDDCDSTLILHLTIEPEAIMADVEQSPTNHQRITKIILNGRLYIIRDDETMYDILGTKIK